MINSIDDEIEVTPEMEGAGVGILASDDLMDFREVVKKYGLLWSALGSLNLHQVIIEISCDDVGGENETAFRIITKTCHESCGGYPAPLEFALPGHYVVYDPQFFQEFNNLRVI